MRKLILFNFLLFITLIIYQQMNVSFYSFIYFDHSQSFFTRNDYALIAFLLLLLLIMMIFLKLKLIRKVKSDLHQKIIYFEMIALMIVGNIISIYMIFAVFYPVQPMFAPIDFLNQPPIELVIVFFIELILITYMMLKYIKFQGNTGRFSLSYHWILPVPYFIFGVIVMEMEGLILRLINESIEFRVVLNQVNQYLFIILGTILIIFLMRKTIRLKKPMIYKITLIFYSVVTIMIILIYWINTIQWR